MSSVNNNYDNSNNDYDFYNEGMDLVTSGDSEESLEEDSEGKTDAASARDQLKQLELQIKQLNPEAQKRLIETLTNLEHQLQAIGEVDNDFEAQVMGHIQEKLGEVGEQVVEFTANGDQFAKYEEALKKLKSETTDNKFLSVKEKEATLKRIEEMQNNLYKGAVDYETLEEDLKPFQNRLEVTKEFEAEAKRTEGLGNQIATDLDRAFSGNQTGSTNAWASAFKGMGKGALEGAGVGLVVGQGVMGAGILIGGWGAGWATTVGIGMLGPGGLAVAGGIALGATIAYFASETDRPHSGLKGAPQPLQDWDLIMGKNSGLLGSKAPGNIVRALNRTDIPPDEQMKLVQKELAALPTGSQGYALSMVVSVLSTRDPDKLKFIAKHNAPLMNFMVESLKTNENAVKTGMVPLGSYDGYKVEFKNGKYSEINTDTSWIRNDWNGRDIDPTALSAPITSAITFLQGLPTSDSAGVDETVSQPPPSSPV